MNADKIIYSLGSGGGGGTNVVANPTLAGTEPALTGLQVGDTKYAVTPDYEVHTYIENKTYTSADADYEQLLEDLTKKRVIKIDNCIYIPCYLSNNTMLYSTLQVNNNISGRVRTFVITINVNSIVISDQKSLMLNLVAANPTLTGTEGALTSISIGNSRYKNQPASVQVLTTAPSSANTDGGIKFVVLTSEPATKYAGYFYYITEA